MQKLQQESYRYVIWAIRHHQSINRHSVVCITVLHAKYDLFGGPGFKPISHGCFAGPRYLFHSGSDVSTSFYEIYSGFVRLALESVIQCMDPVV